MQRTVQRAVSYFFTTTPSLLGEFFFHWRQLSNDGYNHDGGAVKGAYRNGVSIASGRNVLLEDWVIHDVNGTNPRSGVDFEPNSGSADNVPHTMPLVNITLRRVAVSNVIAALDCSHTSGRRDGSWSSTCRWPTWHAWGG
jgi:hypothetical protein